jgi:primosomal protein N' (replication factor Y)
MARGRSVLYLVPEISLSSQIYERLYSVFGDDLVIYHSQLTANQRLHNWRRFYSGDARIAIGTRSASFMQAPDLGSSSSTRSMIPPSRNTVSPRYNARRVALRRGRTENALVLMGSPPHPWRPSTRPRRVYSPCTG